MLFRSLACAGVYEYVGQPEPEHFKHVRDIRLPNEESVMVAMVTQVRDGQVEAIGCPLDSEYGPVIYNITDAELAEAGFVPGEYVPLVYRYDRTNDAYQFLGWASKEAVDEEGT